MRIASDIHLVDGVTCNVYVITEPDGLTIIDAGMPGAEKRILAAVDALGRSPREVRRIILTHQHVDHIGALAALVQRTGAETWASVGDMPAIEGRAQREAPHGALGMVFRAVFFSRLRPCAITHTVRDGETLPALSAEGGVRVIETPGHTIGHISLYLPSRKLLFAGDAVRSSNGRLTLPPPMLNYDTPMARQSLGALAAMDVVACLPGHGAPILNGAQALLAAAAATPSLSRV